MRLVIALLMILGLISTADARHHHHHHRHYDTNYYHPHGLVKVAVAGHRVTVAASAASRFKGFIAALEKRGHIRDIQCYSPTGHMWNSKHHWGGACDFDQRSRNVTARLMYHVTALAHQFGLRDGCEWRHPDCGHIEVPSVRIVQRRPSTRSWHLARSF